MKHGFMVHIMPVTRQIVCWQDVARLLRRVIAPTCPCGCRDGRCAMPAGLASETGSARP